MFFKECEALQREQAELGSEIAAIDDLLARVTKKSDARLTVSFVIGRTKCDANEAREVLVGLCSKGLLELRYVPMCPVTGGLLKEYSDKRGIPEMVYCDLCMDDHLQSEGEICAVFFARARVSGQPPDSDGGKTEDPSHGANSVSFDPSVDSVRLLPGAKTVNKSSAISRVLTWIHLSDLHFGAGSKSWRFDHTAVMRAIERDVANAPRPVDFIFVTGDVAFSAKPEQFEEAKGWLLKIAAAAGCSPDVVRLAPGNHDVDREKTKSISVRMFHEGIRANPDDLDEALAEDAARGALMEKLASYKSFVGTAFPNHPTPLPNGLDWTESVPAVGLRGSVRIAGLSTVWVSDPHDCVVKADPTKFEPNMVLASGQLDPTLGQAKNDELALVLTHHPPECLASGPRANLRRHLAQLSHIHLCGHVHDAHGRVERNFGTPGRAVRYVAGAAHSDPAEAKKHGYSWGAIRWNGGERAWQAGWAPRFYVEARNEMRADSTHFDVDAEGFAWEKLELDWKPPPGIVRGPRPGVPSERHPATEDQGSRSANFEPLHFDRAPPLAEMLRLTPPSPTAALAMSDHGLADKAHAVLLRDHHVLLVGDSGSGKTTLAVGLAGRRGRAGSSVYRYRVPGRPDSRQSGEEIVRFLGAASGQVVLVLEDGDAWLSREDFMRVAAAATKDRELVVSLSKESNYSRDFPTSTVSVTWEVLKEHCKKLVLDREGDAMALLDADAKRFGNRTGTLDPLFTSLPRLVEDFADKSTSPWQFTYLFRSGWLHVEEHLARLIGEGRADVPAIFAAIQQIAGVEAFVTPDETRIAVEGLAATGQYPKPSADWITGVFDALCADRIFTSSRGRYYRPVHRRVARAFLIAGLENPTSAPATEELLLRDFTYRSTTPARLWVLWSWLRDSRAGNRFLAKWISRMTREHWSQLISNTCKLGGVVGLGLAGDLMHVWDLGRPSPRWRAVLGNALLDAAADIGATLRVANENDWPWIADALVAARYSRKEVFDRVIHEWGTESIGRLITGTPLRQHTHIESLYSGLHDHCPEKIVEISAAVDWGAADRCLESVPAGDLESIFEYIGIRSSFRNPLRRSFLALIVAAARKALAAVTAISDLRISVKANLGLQLYFRWFLGFSSEMFAALNVEKLARDIPQSSPHDWQDLGFLVHAADEIGVGLGARLGAAIDLTALSARVSRLGRHYRHQLRELLLVLEYASEERREAFALALRPTLLEAFKDGDKEIKRVATRMHMPTAASICIALGLPAPVLEVVEEEDAEEEEEVAQMIPKIRERVDALEAAGTDYDLESIYAEDI